MSFFSSLQQYVTSGVAGLGLSPRRFSLSRQDGSEMSGLSSGQQMQGQTITGQVPTIGATVSIQLPGQSSDIKPSTPGTLHGE